MFIVDKQSYGRFDLLARCNEMAAKAELCRPEGKLYAVSLKHPFDLICLLQYLREREGSLLLMHGDTPLTTAKETAEKSGCHYLIYGRLNLIINTGGAGCFHPPSLLQFSSGTTGGPKLISRQWRDIDLEIESYNRRFSSSMDEQALILVPVSHSFGLITGVLAAIARESKPVIAADKNPKFALHLIKSLMKPVVYAVPFLFHLLSGLGKEELRLHKLVSSGVPLPEALLLQLEQSTGEVWQQYGCSETGCISLGNHLSSSTDTGKPLEHMTVSLLPVAASDSSLPPENEIIVSSGLSRIHTRDLGYISASGALHVLGRIDDLINVSGLKVIPSEVELVIGRMEGVTEVVVCRTKHLVWGEAVRALVVVAGNLGKEEIKAWCVKHLPAYKVPSKIELVHEIPKLPSGKISRKLLQELERSR